jgi:hypothetical protein
LQILVGSKRLSAELSVNLLEGRQRYIERFLAWSSPKAEKKQLIREPVATHHMIRYGRHARNYDLLVLAEWCPRRCSSLHFDLRVYPSQSSEQRPDFIAEHRMKHTSWHLFVTASIQERSMNIQKMFTCP